MRFQQLTVPSFGPFTDLQIDFANSGSDFHIIFGRNEAGKSSLLRAVRDLLYGIPTQSPDRFLHPYERMKVIASVENSHGRTLTFQRRKGLKNTLLDTADQPIPDESLLPYLGNVDRGFFTTMFGLDSAQLRDGAQALLQGHGELGQALFSASLAGTPVHRIIDGLESEAARLFKGTARKNVTIRPAIETYENANRQSRASIVRPEAMTEVVGRFAKATAAKDKLATELRQLHIRCDWLERCQSALPTLSEIRQWELRLAELNSSHPDSTPQTLDAEFVARAAQALVEKTEADRTCGEIASRMASLRSQQQSGRPDANVLNNQAAIEDVHRQIELYRNWTTEVAELQSTIDAIDRTLAAGLQELGSDFGSGRKAIEQLRIPLESMLELKSAAKSLTSADSAAANHRAEITAIRDQIAATERKLERLTQIDVSAVRLALDNSASCADGDSRLEQLQKQTRSAARKLDQTHKSLELPDLTLAEVNELLVPTPAVIRRFESEGTTTEAAQLAAAKAVKSAERELQKLRRKLTQLERRGELPTEAALTDARQQRDRLWTQIDNRLLNRSPSERADPHNEFDPEDRTQLELLITEYLAAVKLADELSDQLRREADSVAEAEVLRQQIEDAEAAKSVAQDELTELQNQQQDWQQRWKSLWQNCRIAVRQPAEMLEWQELWTGFRSQYEQWEHAVHEQQQITAKIDEAANRLRDVLGGSPEQSLTELREAADRLVRKSDKDQGARETLDADQADQEGRLRRRSAELPELETTAAAARSRWEAVCTQAGLSRTSDPEIALALADRRNAVVAEFDSRTALTVQAAERQRLIAEFERRVNDLAGLVTAPAGSSAASLSSPESIEVRERQLWMALTTARAAHERCTKIADDLEELGLQLESARYLSTAADNVVTGFRVKAGASDDSQLAVVLDYHRTRNGIVAKIEELSARLHLSARGQSLDEFKSAVRAESAETIAAELADIASQSKQLSDQRDEALRILAAVETERETLEKGSDDAAMHRQLAVNTAAQIHFDSARFVRLQLAIQFLRSQVEEFRRQNQQPLMSKASALFHAFTQGSFDEIGTDYDSSDQPILVGRRNGTSVNVAGLSEGTRDQLFLALRLAAIELHQQRHEPMPVILDDLLITFDDQRTAAILPVLCELGRRSQVLLFTHHQHLVDIARKVLPADGVKHHSL